ncbi:hypothetical protein AC578_8770 [Pseudocercospora eumusae]|uniref:Uncharacterized protein n=1 Tax=Pseudocercospora eumusae TaxID=321146 RepID=A0A139H6J1_9PEZI|nr:hypothetical protein AC578_8770 [Pseudocercospora eumusae]
MRELLCGVCLEARGLPPACPKLHVECGKLFGKGMLLITPVWPVERGSIEQPVLEPYFQKCFTELPPELVARIVELVRPLSAAHVLAATKIRLNCLPTLEAKCASHATNNGLNYIRRLVQCQYDGQRYLLHTPGATLEHIEGPPKFAIMEYDDANCTHITFAQNIDARTDTSKGRWYRVQLTSALASKSHVIAKGDVAFFNISPLNVDAEPDCVWSIPCWQPHSWYRCPPSINIERDPLQKPPIQMRVLGNPSNARAITFASQGSHGICGVFLHGNDRNAEQEFYDGLPRDVVCEYVPLHSTDYINGLAILGAGEIEKLCSPCLALSIGGPYRRHVTSGPYIPVERRESFRFVPITQSGRQITSIAVNESLLEGPSLNLRLAIWYADTAPECSGSTAGFEGSFQWPAFMPSEKLRVPFDSGSSTWSKVDIDGLDTFQCCTQDFGGVTVCIGLLITKDGRKEVLGQWRCPYKDPDEHLSCTGHGLRRISIGDVPQVQLVVPGVKQADDVVPLIGSLEWLTDGRGNDVVSRATVA